MNTIQAQAVQTNSLKSYRLETIVGVTIAAILLTQSAYIVSFLISTFI